MLGYFSVDVGSTTTTCLVYTLAALALLQVFCVVLVGYILIELHFSAETKRVIEDPLLHEGMVICGLLLAMTVVRLLPGMISSPLSATSITAWMLLEAVTTVWVLVLFIIINDSITVDDAMKKKLKFENIRMVISLIVIAIDHNLVTVVCFLHLSNDNIPEYRVPPSTANIEPTTPSPQAGIYVALELEMQRAREYITK